MYYLTKAGVKLIKESRRGREDPRKRGIKYRRGTAAKAKTLTPYEQGWKRAGEYIQQLTGQPPRSSDTPPSR